MENTSAEKLSAVRRSQEEAFLAGETLDLSRRLESLKALEFAIHKWEKPIAEALWNDLHKSYEEACLTELSIVSGEIKNHIRNLRKWVSPQKRHTPLKMFPSRSEIISEPLGNSLIIAPWNYPVQLLLNPLVGALSAGCTAVLKPSPYVPNVSRTLGQMISETFSESLVAVVQGNREVNRQLLEMRWEVRHLGGM